MDSKKGEKVKKWKGENMKKGEKMKKWKGENMKKGEKVKEWKGEKMRRWKVEKVVWLSVPYVLLSKNSCFSGRKEERWKSG